jgi:hypothetical protein
MQLSPGLPILWRTHPRAEFPENPSIVFFEQPSIPVHPLQRRFVCEQLRDLSAAWPNHPVIFKPRTSSIESTLHRRHGEMASVIDTMSHQQTNLKLSFKPATQLLRKCGCAITVSSTAALESMAMGISTRIVGDLGVTETLGNHFFADSGAIANFAAIRDNPFEVLHNNRWLQAQGWNPEGDSRFIEALASRLQTAPTPLIEQRPWPHQLGKRSLATHGTRQWRPQDVEQWRGPFQSTKTPPHPSNHSNGPRQCCGFWLVVQAAAQVSEHRSGWRWCTGAVQLPSLRERLAPGGSELPRGGPLNGRRPAIAPSFL